MEKINMRAQLMHHAKAATPFIDGQKQGWQKHFDLPSDFIAFQGHFPDMPVLPAIIQILMAEVTVAEGSGTSIRLQEVSQAKFSMPILPEKHIVCTVLEKDPHVWDCTIMADDALAAKFRFIGVKA